MLQRRASSSAGPFSDRAVLILLPCSLQSTLRPVHNSAVPPMVRATVGGYSVLLALFMAVAVSGFWAFGNSVQVGRDVHNCGCPSCGWQPAASCLCIFEPSNVHTSILGLSLPRQCACLAPAPCCLGIRLGIPKCLPFLTAVYCVSVDRQPCLAGDSRIRVHDHQCHPRVSGESYVQCAAAMLACRTSMLADHWCIAYMQGICCLPCVSGCRALFELAALRSHLSTYLNYHPMFWKATIMCLLPSLRCLSFVAMRRCSPTLCSTMSSSRSCCLTGRALSSRAGPCFLPSALASVGPL